MRLSRLKKTRLPFAVLSGATLLLAGVLPVAAQGANPQTPPGLPGAPTAPTLPAPAANVIPACVVPGEPAVARCHTWIRSDIRPQPRPNATAGGGPYAPADLQSAYNLVAAAQNNGAGQTVAIVDAYRNPNAKQDVCAYRANYNLPPFQGCPNASSSGPTFTEINQSGGDPSNVTTDSGWATEIALDLQMVSAMCPNCNVLLVDAFSASYANLATAVDTAASRGANAISNSYGGSEMYGTSYESHYNHPGIAITVSSGDSGYGVEFPASSPHVTAVGGTSLTRASNPRGWSETAWTGAGSGCSSYFAKPSWQHDSGCGRRTVADASAVADPNTGVWVLDTFGHSGWIVVGGTSAAAPIVGATYALAVNTGPNAGSYPVSSTYGSVSYGSSTAPATLNDVTSGSNGSCGKRTSYLCKSTSGYDGPTGLGTPNGTGAF